MLLFFSFAANASLVADTFGNVYETDTILQIDSSENFEARQLPKDFKEKYEGDEYNYDVSIEETLSIYERFMRWLVNVIARIFKATPEGTGNVLSVIFKILGIGLLLFVLSKILMYFVNKEGNFLFGRSSDSIIIEAKNVEQNIHTTNFNSLIKEALANNDFRLAIRYHYLQVLKTLSKKGKIEWDTEKTNYDYYRELKDKDIKKQFQYISYIYDYCWYGEFEIKDIDYNKAVLAFEKLNNI